MRFLKLRTYIYFYFIFLVTSITMYLNNYKNAHLNELSIFYVYTDSQKTNEPINLNAIDQWHTGGVGIEIKRPYPVIHKIKLYNDLYYRKLHFILLLPYHLYQKIDIFNIDRRKKNNNSNKK